MDEREVERQRILARWQALGPDDPWGQDVEILNAHIVALDTALAASRAELAKHEKCVEEIEAGHLLLTERENEIHDEKDRKLAALEEKLRDAERACRSLFDKEVFANRRAEHAEQRVAGLEALWIAAEDWRRAHEWAAQNPRKMLKSMMTSEEAAETMREYFAKEQALKDAIANLTPPPVAPAGTKEVVGCNADPSDTTPIAEIREWRKRGPVAPSGGAA